MSEQVRITYVRQIAMQLAEFGADIPAWLEQAGLHDEDLSNATLTVPVEVFGALVSSAVSLSRDSGFGLLAGSRLGTTAHGVVGMAVSASANLRQAMEIAERYISLRTRAVTIRTRISANKLEVCFEPALGLGEAANTVVEIAMVAVKNIADYKLARGNTCLSASFAFPRPLHAVLANEVLGCEVRYGQCWSGLSFSLSEAEQIGSQHDALVLTEALRICSNELQNLQSSTTVSTRLERLLLEQRPSFPSLSLSARLLGMAPRTLHRRLAEEESSYSVVLEKVRHRVACEFLRVEGLSVKEVAYLLGYEDVANFRRAFKRWEGVPPSRYISPDKQV